MKNGEGIYFTNFATAILLAASLCIGCSDDDDQTSGSIILDKNTQTEQIVYADDTSKEKGIKFSAAAPWKATVNEISTKTRSGEVEWLKLSAYEGGAGEHTLSLTLMPNLTGEDRMAEIVITCGDSVIRIRVEQKGTKEDGQKPQGAGKIFVEQIITYGSWDQHTYQTITEFTYYEDGHLHTMAEYDDTNLNGTIDNDERQNRKDEFYELKYDDANHKVSFTRESTDKGTTYFTTKGEFKTNEAGFILSGEISTNEDKTTETVNLIVNYKDGYAVNGEEKRGGNYPSHDYCTGTWKNGNLVEIEEKDKNSDGYSMHCTAVDSNDTFEFKYTTDASGLIQKIEVLAYEKETFTIKYKE